MFAELLRKATGFGHCYAVLKAPPDGLGIYARAGFTAVGNVRLFENRSALEHKAEWQNDVRIQS